MNLVRNVVILGILGSGLLVGCSTQTVDDESDTSEGAITPVANEDAFEQAKICDNLFKDRAAFRQVDLDQGVLRWKCGDVDGVTISACEDNLDAIAALENSVNVDADRSAALQQCGDGFGQEYCEFNAVAKGNVVNSVKSARDLGPSDVVECVFTSVHSDVKGRSTPAFHRELVTKLKPQLTSAERPTLEGRIAGMKQSVNSRGAADTLISDCSNLGASGNAALHKNAERQVLCYNAWSAARTETDKKKIAQKCVGTDLSNDTAFAKLGIQETPLTDADKDIAACTMVLKAQHGGVPWRNSDPTICARSYRATHECNVKFKGIGDVAPDFQGFSMQGWTNRETLPPGCKYATMENKPYGELVVCKPTPQDVKTYRTQRKPLQQLCRDKFGVNVAMQAPVGALADLSSAKTDGEFCSSFVRGARKAQGL